MRFECYYYFDVIIFLLACRNSTRVRLYVSVSMVCNNTYTNNNMLRAAQNPNPKQRRGHR